MPDVVVVGGGHNGLVCAAYLAKAGLSVTVVERRHVLGGAAVTEEVFPGFKYSVCSYASRCCVGKSSRAEPGAARADPAAAGRDVPPLHDGYHSRRRIRGRARRNRQALAPRHEPAGTSPPRCAPWRRSPSRCSVDPPGPNAIDVRGLRAPRVSAGRSAGSAAAAAPADQLLSSSALDFVERWSRRAAEGHARGVGIIGCIGIDRLTAAAAAPLHGRDRRRLQVTGATARGYCRGVDGDRRRRDRGRRRAADILAGE